VRRTLLPLTQPLAIARAGVCDGNPLFISDMRLGSMSLRGSKCVLPRLLCSPARPSFGIRSTRTLLLAPLLTL